MILSYENEQYTVALIDQKINVKLPIKNKSVEGESSATDTMNIGTKAKTVTISGLIKFGDEKQLTELNKLAEKTSDDGARVIYGITDRVANAMGVREAKFDGDFDVRELGNLRAWRVSFSLKQHYSIAEASEIQSTQSQTVIKDTATGETISPEQEYQQEATESNGTVFQMLKKLDNWLGQ